MQLPLFLCLFISFVLSSYATTPAQLEADLTSTSNQFAVLDNLIHAFPNSGGTLTQALAIHTGFVNATSSVDRCTSDAKAVVPIPVSEADGRTILTSLKNMEATLDDILITIVTKKPGFQALPLGGIPALIKQDLANLSSSFSALEFAIIALLPTDLLPEASAFKARVDAAFATANAAYA